MSYRDGAQDPFIQELVFTPEMVQTNPADLEIGSIAGNNLVFRKKGSKDPLDGPASVFDLAQGLVVGRPFSAEGLPLAPRGGGAAALSYDGATLACPKAKALFGSALRVVDTLSGNKTKSVSVEIGSTTRSTFLNNPSSPPVLILADPQKRLLSAWPIANVAKQPPTKFGSLPPPVSEGVTSELVNVVHHPNPNGRAGGWVVMTELIQWPGLKSLNPQFKAGSIRAVRWGDRNESNGEKDFWGYAATFVDVPINGQRMRLFCYADRADPKSHMRLHFRDLAPPVPQPHERHPTQPTFLSFDVEIPTYDGSDVPKFVHHVPGRAVIVLTASGIIHAFTLEGSLIGSSRMQHLPPGGADLLCYASAGDRPGEPGEGFYVNVGPIVVRIRLDLS